MIRRICNTQTGGSCIKGTAALQETNSNPKGPACDYFSFTQSLLLLSYRLRLLESVAVICRWQWQIHPATE